MNKLFNSLAIICIFVIGLSFANPHLSASEKSKRKHSSNAQGRNTYHRKECLVFKNPENVGFGAIFFSLLKVLDDFDNGEYAGLEVVFDSGCYVDLDVGPNWWEYIFEPIRIGKVKAASFELSRWEVLRALRKGYRLSRERSSELVQKYIALRPEISEEIENYIDCNFRGHYVIGVHHRGTDKKSESPIVPYSQTLETLKYQISQLSQSEKDHLRIYVATDDSEFLSVLKDEYPKLVIFNDFVRSSDGKPLHYSQDLYSSNYQKCKEAVIDCFLLSRCDFLIYPEASSFSLLSMKLNPKLPTKGIISKPDPAFFSEDN